MSQSSARQGPKAPGRWTFYYDGRCGFCAGWVRALSRLDFFHRISWVPYQSLAEPPPGLSWEDLDRAAYLDTGRGELHEGFYAFRQLTLKLPLLLLLYPALRLPGAGVLGVAAYRRIARNRHRLSRLCRSRWPNGGP